MSATAARPVIASPETVAPRSPSAAASAGNFGEFLAEAAAGPSGDVAPASGSGLPGTSLRDDPACLAGCGSVAGATGAAEAAHRHAAVAAAGSVGQSGGSPSAVAASPVGGPAAATVAAMAPVAAATPPIAAPVPPPAPLPAAAQLSQPENRGAAAAQGSVQGATGRPAPGHPQTARSERRDPAGSSDVAASGSTAAAPNLLIETGGAPSAAGPSAFGSPPAAADADLDLEAAPAAVGRRDGGMQTHALSGHQLSAMPAALANGPADGSARSTLVDPTAADPSQPNMPAAAAPASHPTASAGNVPPAAPALAPASPAAAPSTAAAGTSGVASHAPAPSPAQQVAAAAVTLHGAGGTQQVTVRLDPAELGRVEVQIVRTGDGTGGVTVTAERPETLQLLQHDQSQLQQALSQAGVGEARNMSFHLQSPDPTAQFTAGGAGSGSAGNGGGQGASRRGTRSSRGVAPEGVTSGAGPATRWLRLGIDITA